MVKKQKIWRFAGPVRIIMMLTAVFYGLLYLFIWGKALTGDTEIIFGLADVETDAGLTGLQIVGGMVCMGLFVGPVLLIALSTNKFLKTAYKAGFFEAGVARTLKHLGFSMVLFYLGLMLTENFLPWLITKNLSAELQQPIEWFLLDPKLVALLVGFVLLLLSGAMDEARVIEAENKQII